MTNMTNQNHNNQDAENAMLFSDQLQDLCNRIAKVHAHGGGHLDRDDITYHEACEMLDAELTLNKEAK